MKVYALIQLVVDRPDTIVGIYATEGDADIAELQFHQNPPAMNSEQIMWGGAFYNIEEYEVQEGLLKAYAKKEWNFET